MPFINTSPGNGPGSFDARLNEVNVDPRYDNHVEVTEDEMAELLRLHEAHTRYHDWCMRLRAKERDATEY